MTDNIYLLLIILVLVIIYIWLRIKQRQADAVHVRTGSNGEDYVSRLLSGLSPEYHTFNDLLLRHKGHTIQIDHVVVSSYGVFVIETKNFRGDIYGTFSDKMWLQVFRGKRRRFYSPIRQNFRHTVALSDVCGIKTSKIYSVIVFIGRCELHLKDVNNTVLSKDLLEYIQKFLQQRLSDGDVEFVCRRLERKNITSKYIRRCHQVYANRIKNKYG